VLSTFPTPQLAQLYKALGKFRHDLACLAPPTSPVEANSGRQSLIETAYENPQLSTTWLAGHFVPGWPLSTDVTVSKYNCIFRRCQQCGCSLPPSRGRPPARCIPCKSLAPRKPRSHKKKKVRIEDVQKANPTHPPSTSTIQKTSDYGGYWSDTSEDADDFLY
jgi:hypothetical protein